jgi:hypothetical protein
MTLIFYQSVERSNWSEQEQKQFRSIELDYSYIPLIGVRYVVPVVVGISETWSNALMLALFRKIQNERMTDGVEIARTSKRQKQKKERNMVLWCWCDKKNKKKRRR